jgi:hypothetical protein
MASESWRDIVVAVLRIAGRGQRAIARENWHRAAGTAHGTLPAEMRRATVAVAILAVSTHSSCLLGRHIDFSEAGLPPLTPPTILESGEATPLPNAFIVLTDETTMPTYPAFTLQITARVLQPNPDLGLEARFFIDRPRPCDPSSPACASIFPPDRAAPLADAGTGVWEIQRLVTFPNPVTRGTCHTVDLYVSSQLMPLSAGVQNYAEPARAGDIAHARWFVYLHPAADTANGVMPNITGCSYAQFPNTSNGSVGGSTESVNH